jgi:ribose/xylose/arabinose/galactoside ABC-type transport system permease subunit
MAFDDSSQTSGAGSRYLGEGFRHEPDFRETPATVTGVETAEPDQTVTLARRVAPPNLDYVFDDPDAGEPGRDRLLVHALWELVLALALAGVGYLLYRQESSAFSGDGLRTLLLLAASIGALAAASAVALRAGAPNLAVGTVAIAAAMQFGHDAGGSLLQPLLVVVGLCAVVGLAQGVAVVGLHVPGWAAGVGIAMVLFVWASGRPEATSFDGYEALPDATLWFGAFVAVSVIGSVVLAVPSLRRSFGRFRPVTDPARRRGPVAGVVAVLAIVVSTVLAGVGGVVSVSTARAATLSDGFVLTALALGAALLGGTSAYGRRGGIFGTVLAAALITVSIEYARVTGKTWGAAAVAAVAIGLGLVVTRLVERYGRPANRGPEEEDDDEWASRATAALSNGRSWQPGSTGAGGIWTDDAWGAER